MPFATIRWCKRRVNATSRWPVPRRYAGLSSARSINGRLRFIRNWWSGSLPRSCTPPRSWCWTSTPLTTRCTVTSRVDSFTGTTTATATCRCTCFAVSSCWWRTFGPRTSMGRATRGRVAGQAATPGMARGWYRVSGRLGVLPAPDVRLVRSQRRSIHRGVGPQSGARTRG